MNGSFREGSRRSVILSTQDSPCTALRNAGSISAYHMREELIRRTTMLRCSTSITATQDSMADRQRHGQLASYYPARVVAFNLHSFPKPSPVAPSQGDASCLWGEAPCPLTT